MTILSYKSDFGVVFGGIQANVDFLPTFENGRIWDFATEIGANLSSLGVDPNNYFITWSATIQTNRVAANAPSLQSPLQSSLLAIIATIGSGSVTDQVFINFKLQKTKRYSFFFVTSGVPYLTFPPFVSGGEAPFLAFPIYADVPHADTLCIYPQFVNPPDQTLFLEFTATAVGVQPNEFISNYASSNFIVIESP
jgi:hypothetical protein